MPDDTEVKEVKPQPAVFTPALFWEPRKPTIFKGEPGQDPTKWLQEYLRVSKFNQWDDTLALANAFFFLDGTAKKWFDNNEDLLTSWEVFQTELKKVFGDTQLYVRRAKDILKCRAQKSGESTQSYIQDVLGLCHQIDSNMPEDDKVSHLMKGIAEDVYQALLTKEIRTTADFIKWCQHIEEMQQRRIGHTKFTRLPNVVPIASIDTENDLTSLIRKIVRDEIQKLTVPQAMEPQMDIQSIETIVREEVGRSLNPITSERARTAYSRPQRRIQQTTKPTLEQSLRKTDLWRTTDNRPVCFHCGRLGHVVRYCRDRRAVFDTYRRNQGRDSYSYFNDARTAEETSRQTTRSPSPHPNRGRSPTRRYRSPSPYRRSSQSPGRRNEEN
ncbi:hypothetical protein AVEN_233929-1 [Araneus ventricosus]|uniref:CCHC-type domain-containing protein n=1 Tax=Araneus ventricosus TaxID=182803 RepID=A0A4Y2FCE3_ARAVE|nr:hypothetical protein AVEN_233929-1 [Araneus ventricosus]